MVAVLSNFDESVATVHPPTFDESGVHDGGTVGTAATGAGVAVMYFCGVGTDAIPALPTEYKMASTRTSPVKAVIPYASNIVLDVPLRLAFFLAGVALLAVVGAGGLVGTFTTIGFGAIVPGGGNTLAGAGGGRPFTGAGGGALTTGAISSSFASHLMAVTSFGIVTRIERAAL
jgi:hypothetical protein